MSDPCKKKRYVKLPPTPCWQPFIGGSQGHTGQNVVVDKRAMILETNVELFLYYPGIISDLYLLAAYMAVLSFALALPP